MVVFSAYANHFIRACAHGDGTIAAQTKPEEIPIKMEQETTKNRGVGIYIDQRMEGLNQ